ncbi:MAG TPA: polysaccharide deacetylase family protein [Nitrospirota bacterium]|nr:polysaccharide deacetylase family protein [Nitrospirota bacterium]
MNLTRREFLKLGGNAVLSLSFAKVCYANVINIPVLMYHDVSYLTTEEETVVPPRFAAQMEWLYSEGYQTVFFDEINTLDAARAQRTVIITFDDGFSSFIEYAFPLFQNYRFKSTINIIGEYVGGFVEGNDPRLSWDECRYLVKSGIVEIGCHTYGLHNWYGNKERAEAVLEFNEKLGQDLIMFQKVITRELGRPAKILAWPYDLHDAKSIEIARQSGFSFILKSENEYFMLGSGWSDIPRLSIDHTVNLQQFQKLIEMRS